MLLAGVSVMIFAGAAPALASQPAAALAEPDRALLIAVRQAGRWEIPASQRAQERAASQVVKDVGVTIAEQYAQLDEDVNVLAQRMGVELPDQANEDQQKWLAELDAKSGEEFDRSFAQLLRAANGELFAISSQVRATTRDDDIREFALQVNDITQDHLILLESTGQVDFSALPEPVPPGAAPTDGQHGGVTASASTAGETSTGVQPGLVVAICLAEAVVTVGLLRLFRSR